MADLECRRTARSSATNILNSRSATCIELVVTVAVIIACSVVLAISGDEEPHKPLRAWVVVYLCVSVASLPLLCLRQVAAEDSTEAISQGLLTSPFNRSTSGLSAASECLNWLMECFTLAWFIVGCEWIFSGTSSRSVAPYLYWMTLSILIVHIAEYILKVLVCSAFCCLACILCFIGATSHGSN